MAPIGDRGIGKTQAESAVIIASKWKRESMAHPPEHPIRRIADIAHAAAHAIREYERMEKGEGPAFWDPYNPELTTEPTIVDDLADPGADGIHRRAAIAPTLFVDERLVPARDAIEQQLADYDTLAERAGRRFAPGEPKSARDAIGAGE